MIVSDEVRLRIGIQIIFIIAIALYILLAYWAIRVSYELSVTSGVEVVCILCGSRNLSLTMYVFKQENEIYCAVVAFQLVYVLFTAFSCYNTTDHYFEYFIAQSTFLYIFHLE